jgi:hypothetical protein
VCDHAPPRRRHAPRTHIDPLALAASLVAGCAYIGDKDETWRLDPDGDGSLVGDDCDDSDRDLAQNVTWFTGADGDGFGAPGSEQTGCEAPAGSVDNGDGCDDADNTVFPDAPDEWYDGVDSNCLGDDDYDQDGVGYPNDVDCDDEDPGRAPDASIEETYFNGVDDNCDNTDEDGDGFWAADYVAGVNAAWATSSSAPRRPPPAARATPASPTSSTAPSPPTWPPRTA